MRILEWKSLSAADRRAALQRPAQRDAGRVAAAVRDIIDTVRRGGDAALIDYTRALRWGTARRIGRVGAGVRRSRARAECGPARGARHRDRYRARVSRGASAARAAHRDGAGSDLRAHQRAGARGRSVRSGGLRPAALHRHHAGGAGRYRRLPGARDVHRPDASRQRRPGGSGRRAQGGNRARLQGRRCAGDRRHGVRDGVDPEVRQAVRSRQHLGDDGQNDGRERSCRRRRRLAGRSHRGHGHRRRQRARGLHRGRSARPSRARPRRASLAGHPVDGARRRRRARGAAADGHAVAPGHPRRLGGQHAAARGRHPRRRIRRCKRLRTRALAAADPRAAQPARRCACGGSGVSRQLVARVHGRLLQRPESHSAHLRIRKSLQRIVAGGFPEAHLGPGAHAGRACAAWARPRGSWRLSKGSTRMPHRSQSASHALEETPR